jgi:flavodoxin I
MKCLVIYDTKWGHTEQIAKAIAAGMGKGARAVRVGDPESRLFDGIDLLVIGSPVHGGRPTKPVQEMLKDMRPEPSSKMKVAAFDTRMTMKFAQKFGFAAVRMADQLKEQGFSLNAEPEGFIVEGQKGPLGAGELERAEKWGKTISRRS